jgi:hypothetical protein
MGCAIAGGVGIPLCTPLQLRLPSVFIFYSRHLQI